MLLLRCAAQWLLCDLKSPEDKKRRRNLKKRSQDAPRIDSAPRRASGGTAIREDDAAAATTVMQTATPAERADKLTQQQPATSVGLFSALQVCHLRSR